MLVKIALVVALAGTLFSVGVIAQPPVKTDCDLKRNAQKAECNVAKKAPAKTTTPAKTPAKTNVILETQKQLSRLGYNPGPLDGLMGKKTRQAIMAFQKNHGKPMDGKASEKLLQLLKSSHK